MSALFEAPAPSPLHRYFTAVLLRVRRFVNRSVANMLESRERQAKLYMLKRLSQRKESSLRRISIGVRIALYGLIVASSLPLVAAKAEAAAIRLDSPDIIKGVCVGTAVSDATTGCRRTSPAARSHPPVIEHQED